MDRLVHRAIAVLVFMKLHWLVVERINIHEVVCASVGAGELGTMRLPRGSNLPWPWVGAAIREPGSNSWFKPHR